MREGYTQQIKNKIEQSPAGTVFIHSDFARIAGTETVRRSLNRFTQTGHLRRILNGVYEKPKYSSLLHEYVAVNPDAVANAIARNYHWTIVPCGDSALNLLGLSTQVPAVWVYVSDGPYRKYLCGHTAIEFRHRTNREISGLSYMTRLLVQALKALGKEQITQEVISFLSDKLTSEEKRAALQEAAFCLFMAEGGLLAYAKGYGL